MAKARVNNKSIAEHKRRMFVSILGVICPDCDNVATQCRKIKALADEFRDGCFAKRV
jgi:hypothetical protein